jgi:thiamine biosynthesis lipoprotein
MVLNNSTDGDIFSTALFILGVDRGLMLIKQFPGVEAIIVTKDGQVVTTPGLAGKVEVTSN